MSKIRLFTMLGAIVVIASGYFLFREYRIHKLSYLASSYGGNIEDGKFYAAEKNAREMMPLSKDMGRESLAHVGVIKFVQNGSDDSSGILQEVGMSIEDRGRTDLSGPPAMLATMASVAAMSGKRAEALAFLRKSCEDIRSDDSNILECAHKMVDDYRHPNSLMINAVKLYEAAYLEDFLFRRDHDRYYMLISAEYFDPKRAVERFKLNVKSSFFNRDDINAYCHKSVLSQTKEECESVLAKLGLNTPKNTLIYSP